VRYLNASWHFLMCSEKSFDDVVGTVSPKTLAVNICIISSFSTPHVVGAQLYRLSTVDAHTDVLKPIHGKII